jgi:hypothetical protein
MKLNIGDFVVIESDHVSHLEYVGRKARVNDISDDIVKGTVVVQLLDSSGRITGEQLTLPQHVLILEWFINYLDDVKHEREIENPSSGVISRATYVYLGNVTSKHLKEMLSEEALEELEKFYRSLEQPNFTEEINFLSSFFTREFENWARLIPANGYDKFIEGLVDGIRPQ